MRENKSSYLVKGRLKYFPYVFIFIFLFSLSFISATNTTLDNTTIVTKLNYINNFSLGAVYDYTGLATDGTYLYTYAEDTLGTYFLNGTYITNVTLDNSNYSGLYGIVYINGDIYAMDYIGTIFQFNISDGSEITEYDFSGSGLNVVSLGYDNTTGLFYSIDNDGTNCSVYNFNITDLSYNYIFSYVCSGNVQDSITINNGNILIFRDEDIPIEMLNYSINGTLRDDVEIKFNTSDYTSPYIYFGSFVLNDYIYVLSVSDKYEVWINQKIDVPRIVKMYSDFYTKQINSTTREVWFYYNLTDTGIPFDYIKDGTPTSYHYAGYDVNTSGIKIRYNFTGVFQDTGTFPLSNSCINSSGFVCYVISDYNYLYNRSIGYVNNDETFFAYNFTYDPYGVFYSKYFSELFYDTIPEVCDGIDCNVYESRLENQGLSSTSFINIWVVVFTLVMIVSIILAIKNRK